MKFTYQEVKNISTLINDWQTQYWELRDKYGREYPLNHQLLDQLDEIIFRLKKVSHINSKNADFDELKSDIEFIEEYYEIKRFSSVNRWFSNRNSTLRETFSDYMTQLKKQKNFSKN